MKKKSCIISDDYFSAVMPAKAGIQGFFKILDSRFRGNDGWTVPLSAFLFFLIIFVYNGTALVQAEPPPGEKKIRLEKVQIIGAVERPGTFYLIPWRSPASQEKVNFEFSRDFKKEIFEFVDQESWTRRKHGDDR